MQPQPSVSVCCWASANPASSESQYFSVCSSRSTKRYPTSSRLPCAVSENDPDFLPPLCLVNTDKFKDFNIRNSIAGMQRFVGLLNKVTLTVCMQYLPDFVLSRLSLIVRGSCVSQEVFMLTLFVNR